MGHNSVISGHPKSTGISQVDGLSMGPPYLGHHIFNVESHVIVEYNEDEDED